MRTHSLVLDTIAAARAAMLYKRGFVSGCRQLSVAKGCCFVYTMKSVCGDAHGKRSTRFAQRLLLPCFLLFWL